MKIIILLTTAFIFFGCGRPVGFNSTGGPDWVNELDSRVESGEEAKKNKINNPGSEDAKAGKAGKEGKAGQGKSAVESRKENAVVAETPAGEPPPRNPEWVEDREDKVTVKKVGKKSSSSSEVTNDLINPEQEKETEIKKGTVMDDVTALPS